MAAWLPVCRAQLGETRATVAKRFGPAVHKNARVREHRVLEGAAGDSELYEKDGCYIRAVYAQERAVQLEFSKKIGAFDAKEIEALLAANAAGSKWEAGKDSTKAIRFYRRLDGGALASWTTDFHGSLLITAEQTGGAMQKLLSSPPGE